MFVRARLLVVVFLQLLVTLLLKQLFLLVEDIGLMAVRILVKRTVA